jgi:hypothetical protein
VATYFSHTLTVLWQVTVVSRVQNYQRSLRFQLLYARTNAQSRALKGLPTTDEPSPEPPTWMAIPEFSAEPALDLMSSIWNISHTVLEKAKQNRTEAYVLERCNRLSY